MLAVKGIGDESVGRIEIKKVTEVIWRGFLSEGCERCDFCDRSVTTNLDVRRKKG